MKNARIQSAARKAIPARQQANARWLAVLDTQLAFLPYIQVTDRVKAICERNNSEARRIVNRLMHARDVAYA